MTEDLIQAVERTEAEEAAYEVGYADGLSEQEPHKVLVVERTIEALLASMTVENRDHLRALLAGMDRCDHLCYHGPGHQSHTTCAQLGRHTEHYVETGSGSFSWQDSDERDVQRTAYLKDDQGDFLRDEKGKARRSEPFTEAVYFAPYM